MPSEGWHILISKSEPRNIAAHTSPIYINVNNQEVFSHSDAVYMLNLLNGGMEWLDTLSIRADENTHQRIRSVFELAEHELKAKWVRTHGHYHS